MESEKEYSAALQRVLEEHARDQIAPPTDLVGMAIRDIRQKVVEEAEVWEPILAIMAIGTHS
jgi:hypothetical protein